jgi:hypothetical protein
MRAGQAQITPSRSETIVPGERDAIRGGGAFDEAGSFESIKCPLHFALG